MILNFIKAAIIIAFLIPVATVGAQDTDVDFVINKIKLDYPGFSSKTTTRRFNRLVKSSLKHNSDDTFKALSIIVRSFHDPHLQICILNDMLKIDTPQCNINLESITKCLSKSLSDPREGYWLNEYNDCIIGLSKHGAGFQGIVIQSSSEKLIPGEILAEMEKTDSKTYITKFISPNTGGSYYLNSIFRSDTLFTTGAESKWTRLRQYDPANPILFSLKRRSDSANGKLISDSTYLITLPINSTKNTQLVRAIIKRDSGIIAKTRNLLIDIRGNIGGKSATYMPLVPYAYTKPIISVGADMYATEDGIARYEKNIDKLKSSGLLTKEQESYYQKDISNLKQNIGKFVVSEIDTIILDEIKRYPLHVGIITDYACQSAAEMLVLTLKQSSKVLTFGEQTMGAVDYLDFYPMSTASKRYVLYMPTTKRKIGAEGELDGKGLKPDVELTTNESNWINNAEKHLNNL